MAQFIEKQKIQKNNLQYQKPFGQNASHFVQNPEKEKNILSADILSGSRNQKIEEDLLKRSDFNNAQENIMNYKFNHKNDSINNLEQLSQFDDEKNYDQYQNESDRDNEVDGIALQFLKDPSQLRELNKFVKKIIPLWSKLESASKEDEHGLMSQIFQISFGEQAEKTKQLEKKNQAMQLKLETQEKQISDLTLALNQKKAMPNEEESKEQDKNTKEMILSIISDNFTEIFTNLFTAQVKPMISKFGQSAVKWDDINEKVKSLEKFNQIINNKYSTLLETIENKKIEENISDLLERVAEIENNSYKNHIADLIQNINQAYEEAKQLNINTKFLIQKNDARFNNLEQHIQYLQHIQSSSQKIESQKNNQISESHLNNQTNQKNNNKDQNQN